MQNKQLIFFEKAAVFYPERSGVWYGFVDIYKYVGVSVGDELLTSVNNIKLFRECVKFKI